MCQGRFYRSNDIRAGWTPIGPGDSEVWIETQEDRENPEETQETIIETEVDVENETEKENV